MKQANWNDFFDDNSTYNKDWEKKHNDYNYRSIKGFKTKEAKDLAMESFLATKEILRNYEEKYLKPNNIPKPTKYNGEPRKCFFCEKEKSTGWVDYKGVFVCCGGFHG